MMLGSHGESRTTSPRPLELRSNITHREAIHKLAREDHNDDGTERSVLQRFKLLTGAKRLDKGHGAALMAEYHQVRGAALINEYHLG